MIRASVELARVVRVASAARTKEEAMAMTMTVAVESPGDADLFLLDSDKHAALRGSRSRCHRLDGSKIANIYIQIK